MHVPKSSVTIMLLLVLGCAMLACTASAPDNSLRDLYSNILQREYSGPISYPNHQVERKAQRSPSLRLRFGRRSDSSFPIFGNRFSKYIEEINKKPIRSPSLRLRFGKRDPNMLNDDVFTNDLSEYINNKHWNEPLDSVPYPQDIDDQSEYDAVPEKRKPVHLRFGRSYGVHDDNPNNDRPVILSDDANSIPRLNQQSPKAGDLVSATGF